MSSTEEDGNVGVALALVLGAGLSTGIGAAVVFVPSLVKLASRRVLASSLGFSAGVMTYVSYVEIFGKSMSEFENAGHDERMAYTYATLCFFGGIAVMLVRTQNSEDKKPRSMEKCSIPVGFVFKLKITLCSPCLPSGFENGCM